MTDREFSLSNWVDEAIVDFHGRNVIKNWLRDNGYETILALSELDPLTIPKEIQDVNVLEGWKKALSASIKQLIKKNLVISSTSGMFLLVCKPFNYYCFIIYNHIN